MDTYTSYYLFQWTDIASPAPAIVERFVRTKVISVRNKDKHCFYEDCRQAFHFKQKVNLRCTRDCSRVNWNVYVLCKVRANEIYAEAGRQFSARRRDALRNAQCPHRWWSTHEKKGKVFYGQEPSIGESTTTEFGVNYQLLSVIYWSSPMGNS